MNNEMKDFLWCEKYRPKILADCILSDEINTVANSIITSGEIPNLMLSGPPGLGKTTLAKILCESIGCDYLFINGSSENGIDTFRTKISDYASSVSLNGGKKVIIIDESEYMNSASLQPALRFGIEQFSKNCTFILTCNYKNRIIQPIHSRCTNIDFSIKKGEKKQLLVQFFKRVCSILSKENIEYDKEVLAVLINKFFPDFRKTLVELQRYASNGKIDSGILSQVSDIQLKDLIKYLKEKDFTKTRTWVVENADNDPNLFYRKIYDGLSDFLKPSSIPNIILIMAKYQYQTSFVVDHEIQLISFLTEVMLEGEFK